MSEKFERTTIGLQVPVYLSKWCDKKGIEKFGRKNSKSDYVRSLIMEKYEEEQKLLRSVQVPNHE